MASHELDPGPMAEVLHHKTILEVDKVVRALEEVMVDWTDDDLIDEVLPSDSLVIPYSLFRGGAANNLPRTLSDEAGICGSIFEQK
eukprot:1575460-Amphidinium_carterae.1